MLKDQKKRLIERIKEVVIDLGITAYEIAKNTTLSEVGISKILSGKVGNPNASTLEVMISYLVNDHNISIIWLTDGSGMMKDISIPTSSDFLKLTETQKKKKLDEIAVFIAHNEEELMNNPVFRSIIERRGYQMVLTNLRDEVED